MIYITIDQNQEHQNQPKSRYHYKKVHSQKEPEPPKEKEPEVVTADYKEPEKSEYLDEVVKDEELMIDDDIPIKTYDENTLNKKAVCLGKFLCIFHQDRQQFIGLIQ